MPRPAGRTISIRVPDGVPEEIRAATGLPFSTFVRLITMAALERYRGDRRAAERKDQVADDVRSLVGQHMDK